jgi:hypothetical protein
MISSGFCVVLQCKRWSLLQTIVWNKNWHRKWLLTLPGNTRISFAIHGLDFRLRQKHFSSLPKCCILIFRWKTLPDRRFKEWRTAIITEPTLPVITVLLQTVFHVQKESTTNTPSIRLPIYLAANSLATFSSIVKVHCLWLRILQYLLVMQLAAPNGSMHLHIQMLS